MALFVLLSVLIVQTSLTIATDDIDATRDALKAKPEPEHDWSKLDNEWSKMNFMDMFKFQDGMFPTSSVSMMSQVTSSNKTADETVQEIKEIAGKISECIQREMANLLAFALDNCDKETKDTDTENNLRKKRSAETPMDSSQHIMRLLKHIKANNEYQNIAIEKMMSAQEIADKYGIDFNPDPEILTDLAFAANEQTQDLSNALSEACDAKNVTKQEEVKFVPLNEQISRVDEHDNGDVYYVYSLHPEEVLSQAFAAHEDPFAPYEYAPQQLPHQQGHQHQHHHQPEPHYHYNPTPAPPVTPRPNYYDSMMGYAPDFYSYCPVEPVTTTTTIFLPIEEQMEPEPELVGEEYEETVTSKVTVDRDEEPGSATVNHVMTYTINEKAHFRTPEIERLPQQMQYTFFLM